MGGSGASKLMVAPPGNWNTQGGTKSFEVISPCSDLSNPSDFNRVRYNRQTNGYQHNRGRNHDKENRHSGPSNKLSRKNSKYSESSGHDLGKLPVAVKVRRSNEAAGNNRGDMIAPGAFYFPTKESERRADHRAKQELRSGNLHIASIPNSRRVQNNGDTKSFRSLARRAAKKMKKRKDTVKRIALAVGHACLEETRNKRVLESENGLKLKRVQHPAKNLDGSRCKLGKTPSSALKGRRRSEQVALGGPQVVRHNVPLNKLKKDCNIKKNDRYENQMDQLTSAALHQADAYFERLSLSSSNKHGASPFVRSGAGMTSGNRITSILESSSKKTPNHRTRRPSLDSAVDTPVSDLFSANSDIPKMEDNDYLISSSSKNKNVSPVSSLMRFYSKSGPMESSPKSYCSDELFVDERSEESSMKREKNLGRQSQDSPNSLYTTESNTYRKVNGKDLKILAYNESEEESDEDMPKVSKLESLFRPILPALSTDDAQSVYSYDPYEIKVTESAPGAIQASVLGFRTSISRKSNLSPSMSVLSIDSQKEPSTNSSKNMVSNQARHNGDFLFTDDYGPVIIAKNPNRERCDPTFAISTAGSRSRLTQKTTQKGVTIQMGQLENETDEASFTSRSTKSERRVRFSQDPIRLLSEEREESDTKADEESQARLASKPSHMKFHKFASKVNRVDSIDESIDLPEIENKPSDVSEMSAEESCKSLESARSIRSRNNLSNSIPEEDEMTEFSNDVSIHWTKTQNGYTPHGNGKTLTNPTKSPYQRYLNAKIKFNTQDLTMLKLSEGKTKIHRKNARKSPAKSPAKSPRKSPAKVLRKGSGGLVSMRVQELNTRVSEVRKLKRMRKKMTNPRLHTHNFDNTQPVRSRTLMNYKTSFGSANITKSNNMMAAKFNVIPDVDVDDDDDSTKFSQKVNDNEIVRLGKVDVEDDDESRMSEITGATIATVRQERGSIATVRQERGSIATVRQERVSPGYSMNSRSTASSGLTRLKKQVFRTSDGTRSIVSSSDSTTISAMIHKENENQATMLAPPSRGTPAMKWRTLAAAAAEKDARKVVSSNGGRKKLGTRSINCDQYQVYGFKD